MILHMDNVLIGGDPYNTEFNGAGDCELQKKTSTSASGISSPRPAPSSIVVALSS